MIDKRTFHRMRMQMLAGRVRSTRDGQYVWSAVRVADLSGDGAQLIAPRRFLPEDRIDLHLPGGQHGGPVHASGRVVWSAPITRRFWRAGVQFCGVTAKDREALVERALLEQFYSSEVLEALLQDVEHAERGR